MRTTLAALALALTACGPAELAPLCAPGERRSCACLSVASGAQVCDDDGERFGGCACAEAADASAADGRAAQVAELAAEAHVEHVGDAPTTDAPAVEVAVTLAQKASAVEVGNAPAAEARAVELADALGTEERAVRAHRITEASAGSYGTVARPPAEPLEEPGFVIRSLVRLRGDTPVMCLDSFAVGERIDTQPRNGLTEIDGSCFQSFPELAVRATCYRRGDGFSIREHFYRAAAVASDAERLRCLERHGSWFVEPPPDPSDPNARIELPLYDTGFGVDPGCVL